MEREEQKFLGIYIHIPFCVRKCFYCDFLSAPAKEQERADYVEALCREIIQESKKYREYMVNTIFIGGGTPSLLESECISKILNRVHENYKVSDNCEITMEVNPGTVTWEKLVRFKASGGNRLSIGLQSAIENELRALGRIHTYEDFLMTYELALKAGFSNINVDLMTGVPGQNIESLVDTLNKITGLSKMPSHISAYSLIIEEGTPFYKKTPELPDEDLERELYKITNDFLRKKGYVQYEISNYALPGYKCRHNTVYWRRGNYVGFGIGAASMVENVRFHNTDDREKYMNYLLNNKYDFKAIYEKERCGQNEVEMKNKKTYVSKNNFSDASQNVIDSKENVQKCFRKYSEYDFQNNFKKDLENDLTKEDIQVLSIEEQMEEFMFLGLRMKEGVCKNEFLRTFGKTMDEVYPGIVEGFCQKGLLILRREPVTGEDFIALTPFGMDVSNRVMSEFLLERH